MNLAQSLTMESLQAPIKVASKQRLTAQEMAERVFQISAQSGNPYKNITAKQWARKWLTSPEFVLTEVETDRIALMRTPRNTNQVLRNMAASKESLEPVVVDLNKQGLSSRNGYRPSVVAVDGAHRAYGLYLQGRDTIMAWVGVRALPKVKVQPLVRASAIKVTGEAVSGTKVSSAAILHAAQGLPNPPRQDVGDGGPSPTMSMPSVKSGVPTGSKYIKDRGVKATGGGTGGAAGTGGGAATGAASGPGGSTSGPTPPVNLKAKKKDLEARTPEARSSGQLADPDPSDTKVPPDPSDAGQSVDPSDRLQYDGGTQIYPPGVREWEKELRGPGNPISDAPGSGVGPRLKPNKGASRSDMQKRLAASKSKKGCVDCGMDMDAAGKWVKKIVTDYKKALKAGYRPVQIKGSSVPKSCEKMVHGLKKSGSVDNPWAVANWAHSEGRC